MMNGKLWRKNKKENFFLSVFGWVGRNENKPTKKFSPK